ncbi:NIPA-like protein 2 [Termitomyces sp. T112]|nr:NIPA-like protein 2 [Termitomyces sp. T112]
MLALGGVVLSLNRGRFSTFWTEYDLPHLTKATFIGILIAVSGNVLISLALNLQKLAHRRVEAEIRATSQETAKGASANGTQRRRSDDQNATQRTTLLNVVSSDARPTEAGPLVSLPHPHDYGSVTNGTNGGPANIPHPRLVLLSRLIPAWFHRRKSERSMSVTPMDGVIAVDVMSEETTLHRQRPQSHRQGMVEDGNETAYLRSKLWWSGFFLMNIGETGNFISYAWAPASVVAPLGTFALMANCFFAPLLLGERFRKRDLVGIVIAIIGAVTVVLATNASNTPLDPDVLLEAISQTPFIIYSCIYLVGAVILGALSHSGVGRQWVFVDVGLCALFGGFTVLSTKAISTLLTLEWITMFSKWITYPILVVLIVTGVGQIRYLNRALMRFDSKVVIPVQFVLFTLSAIIGSAILYGDFRRAKFHEIVTFLYGCAATFLGVFIIAWAPSSELADPENGPHSDFVSVVSSGNSPRLERSRATLVMRSDVRDTPGARNQHNNVSLLGLSPAQHLLLVHTPPRDAPIHGQMPQPANSNHSRIHE